MSHQVMHCQSNGIINILYSEAELTVTSDGGKVNLKKKSSANQPNIKY